MLLPCWKPMYLMDGSATNVAQPLFMANSANKKFLPEREKKPKKLIALWGFYLLQQCHFTNHHDHRNNEQGCAGRSVSKPFFRGALFSTTTMGHTHTQTHTQRALTTSICTVPGNYSHKQPGKMGNRLTLTHTQECH